MDRVVTVAAKKEFLCWFLNHYQLKTREAHWFLSYLIRNKDALKSVHFIEQFKKKPNTLILSTTCVYTSPIKYFNHGTMNSDARFIFTEIYKELQKDDRRPLYIVLIFKERLSSPEYHSVLEPFSESEAYDDPLATGHIMWQNGFMQGNEIYYQGSMQVLISWMAEWILQDAINQFQKQQLYRQIDEALEKRDKASFMALTSRLKALKEEQMGGVL